MKMIVGLGNIGTEYQDTRHNLGFWVLDHLYQGSWDHQRKLQALIGMQVIAGEKCLLVKPTTYMNNSGTAVLLVAAYYKIQPQDILVIYDDVSLEVGKYRIRGKGSSGGQKGIADILRKLQTEEIARFKIGIGGGHLNNLNGHVLGKITPQEMAVYQSLYAKFAAIITAFVGGGVVLAQRQS